MSDIYKHKTTEISKCLLFNTQSTGNGICNPQFSISLVKETVNPKKVLKLEIW